MEVGPSLTVVLRPSIREPLDVLPLVLLAISGATQRDVVKAITGSHSKGGPQQERQGNVPVDITSSTGWIEFNHPLRFEHDVELAATFVCGCGHAWVVADHHIPQAVDPEVRRGGDCRVEMDVRGVVIDEGGCWVHARRGVPDPEQRRAKGQPAKDLISGRVESAPKK